MKLFQFSFLKIRTQNNFRSTWQFYFLNLLNVFLNKRQQKETGTNLGCCEGDDWDILFSLRPYLRSTQQGSFVKRAEISFFSLILCWRIFSNFLNFPLRLMNDKWIISFAPASRKIGQICTFFFLFCSLSGNPEILSWKMVWDPEGNNGWWQLITVKLYASRSNEFFFCTLKKAIEMSKKSQEFFENSFWELVINNVDF